MFILHIFILLEGAKNWMGGGEQCFFLGGGGGGGGCRLRFVHCEYFLR